MKNPGCQNCSHWKMNQGGETGLCLRFPPTPMIVGMGLPPGSSLRMDKPPQPTPLIQAIHPTTGPEQTCGEFSPTVEGLAS